MQRAVDRLREVYPDSEMLVGYDGVPSLGISGAENILLPRAKTPAHGGLWTHRYLSLALSRTRMKYIMRVDADTDVIARAHLSYDSGIFGQHRNIGTEGAPHWVIHGAALGYTRVTAEQIVSNGWMLDQRFVNSKMKTIDDAMLLSMATERGISVHHRPDFACGPKAYDAPNPSFRHR